MQLSTSSNIPDDELTCPITLQIFRDPVIASDGHAYEREAIVKWILQNGTSPLTREPLCIDDLRHDDRLKRLAVRRRNSVVSYVAYNENVVIGPPAMRITFRVIRNSIRPPQPENRLCGRLDPCKCTCMRLVFWIVLAVVVAFLFIFMVNVVPNLIKKDRGELLSNTQRSTTTYGTHIQVLNGSCAFVN